MLIHLLRWLYNRRQAELHRRKEQERRLAWEETIERRVSTIEKVQLLSAIERITALECYEEAEETIH